MIPLPQLKIFKGKCIDIPVDFG